MAKRKRIIKLLEYAYKEEEKEITEESAVYDFRVGVLFGINLVKEMIKNKRDKELNF